MHLLIDGQALQTPSSRQRGIGRFGRNLLRALAAARPDWRIEMVQNGALAPLAADDRNGWPVLSFQPPLPPHPAHHEINDRFYADWLTAQGAEAVLILSPFEGWEAVVPSFCGPRPRLFGVVHDLIPLLYSQQYLSEFGTAHWYAHRFRQMLRSDALLSNSETTAQDVRRLGGSAAPLVVNIAGAVDPLFAPLSPRDLDSRGRQVRARFGLQRDFLLYVGALDYNKNLHGALQAFAALSPDYRAALDLAVVCRLKPTEQAVVENMAHAAGVGSALRLICSAGDEELRALYQMCRLFFFPSHYEGLGLPVLEALHCGAPVVTSNCSSLPEYAGPCSWLGDPASPQAMAQVLQQALTEPRDARRAEREAFARSFSWQRSAERAAAVMERITKRRNFPAGRRRRLAWVMPLTSAARGMVEYAAEVLPLLDEHFDIELIAAPGPMEIPQTLSSRYFILTAEEVLTRHAASPYAMFLYQLGTPPRHEEMLALLAQFPGLLVLHDFSPADIRYLTASKVLSSQAVSELVLGVLVHTTEAWEQIRHSLDVPAIHLAEPWARRTRQGDEQGRFAAAYVAWIEQAIARFEQSDGPWRGFVLQSLRHCSEPAGNLIDSWTMLRARIQQCPVGRAS